MTHPIRNRSRLMVGCGSAALALALVMAPRAALAQGVQATPTVTLGDANVNATAVNETTVTVRTPVAVIDWDPFEDAGGNALDFLPTGNSLIFQDLPGQGGFSVLNRILPATNGNIAVMNGQVISRLQAASGPSTPGGFVAFYSPTGLLVGDNATFDVGRLLLTTLDPDVQSFQNFANFGGNLSLQGAAGSTARIQINPGAQILATPENSFFAVVAADVQMLGTARINGSHAYVAGEVVNLSFSNGLFNIFVPVGTAATGNVLRLDGDIGGPSSNGLGDNHMIYALARAAADPISMIFRGNLGFDPAQSAGIVNGEIILSANYNVFGRNVDGGSISDGISAVFNANSGTSTVRADIFMEDFAASSSVLAISTHRTQVTARTTASSVAGNLLMVGRENAELTASNGQSFTVSGDVLVSAQDYGVVSSSVQSLDQINAGGGIAFIDAFGGGTMDIGGDAVVAADAFAGADTGNLIAGTAQGGQALIGSTGGTLDIAGDATVSARGVGTSVSDIQTGATVRGGLAQFFATQGGDVTLGGDLVVRADALGAQGSLFSPSSVSNAFGGNAFINIFNGGGTIAIGGVAFASASAVGGSSNNAGAGSIGDAGQAIANVNGGGQITITGTLEVEADGTGGDNVGGTGGVGLGGRASSAIFAGGTIDIGQAFNADATGLGGNGLTGGDGFGGIAGANALVGDIIIGGDVFASAAGLGGGAFFGFGGNGGLGRGGNAFLQADGTLTQTATLTIAGDAVAFAQGVGGAGGDSDGQAIAGGRGGDGYGGQFAVTNQADPAFGSGAYILAGGDNGTLSVGGETLALATGFGGRGGSGITNPLLSGTGGNGFGGLAQVGLALLGQNGSLGLGSASFARLIAESLGVGGDGGGSGGDFPTGAGGNGTAGNAFLTASAGDITADQIELTASGFGGGGGLAGTGNGGQAAVLGSLGGTLTANQINILAQGFGGFSALGTGGDAFGGLAAIEGDGITVTINGNATVNASASGGSSDDGAGGNAEGGEAYIATVTTTTPGSITITGHAQVFANALGGGTLTNFVAGSAFGGTAFIEALGGSTINMGSVQVLAEGRGGSAQIHQSGNGTGGEARIAASGANSRVTILRNVTTTLAQDSGTIAIISANGIGDTTNGGTGVGGSGRGGSILIAALAGGSVALPANPVNDPDSVGPLQLDSSGFGGGSTTEGGAGGQGSGGNAAIEVDGGTLTMGAAVFSVFGEGGSSLDTSRNIAGGRGIGGNRLIRVLNGGSASLDLVSGLSGAQGGTGSGTGDGGDAFGGSSQVVLTNGTLNITGTLVMVDQTIGGDGNNGGDAFGAGEGGGMGFSATDSVINVTPSGASDNGLTISVSNRGGAGVASGGNAFGGLVNAALTGTTVNGGRLDVSAFALGGEATAPGGIGGNANLFGPSLNVVDSTLNLVGGIDIFVTAQGGNGGATGGDVTNGNIAMLLDGSTINVAAPANGSPSGLSVSSSVSGGTGILQGGSAQGGTIGLTITDTTVTGRPRLTVRSDLRAGDVTGPDGIGGFAQSDDIAVDILRSNLSLSGETFIISLAEGGFGATGNNTTGGDAVSGTVEVSLTDSILNIALGSAGLGTLQVLSLGLGGVGDTVGSGTADRAALLVAGSDISVDDIEINSAGRTDTFNPPAGQIGGVAQSGVALLALEGDATITARVLELFASAATSTNGTARAGEAMLTIAPGSTAVIQASDMLLRARGFGSTVLANNIAGRFDLQLDSGTINAGNFVAQELGDAASAFDPSQLVVNGGSLNVSGNLRVETFGNVLIRTSGGGIIGGPRAAATTTQVQIASGGLITIEGGSNTAVGLGGDVISLAARDIEIVDGARIGADEVFLISNDRTNTAVLGGTTEGDGFTLTAAEIGRIATRELSISVPNFTNANAPNQPDLLIRDLSITGTGTGTGGNGVAVMRIFAGSDSADGLIRVEGTLSYINAGADDLLDIEAQRLEVVTPGGIRIEGANNAPAGDLDITANDIWVADTDTIAQLQANRSFAGRDDVLETAASASADPLGYIRAGGVTLRVRDSLLVRNTGIAFAGGGILVGEGGLSIIGTGAGQSGAGAQLDVIAYGRRRAADGTFVLGDAFFDEVNFNRVAPGTTLYLDASAFNDCIITSGICPDPPPPPRPPVELLPQITNPTIIEGPLQIGEQPPMSAVEQEERFGMDFPEQPDAPLISEDPLLDDPVSSGGDASLYSGGTAPTPRGEEK